MKLVNTFLKNKFVYYGLVVASVLHLIGYLSIRNFDAFTFFIAIGFLSSFFSKNKNVTLITAIVATNLLYTGSFIRENFTEGKKKKNEDEDEDAKENYVQRNIPSSRPKSLSNDETDETRIDYASTLEQAYDNLQNILGSDGMKGLTGETKRLISQQKTLVSSLDNMGPALKSAQETMAMFKDNMPDLAKFSKFVGKVGNDKKT